MKSNTTTSLILISILSITSISSNYHFFSNNKDSIMTSNHFEEIKKLDLPYETYSYEESPFKDWSNEELKSLMGAKDLFTESSDDVAFDDIENAQIDVNALPDDFDSRTRWPGCVGAVKNQQNCGSCWAFALTSTLADRFCIASNGLMNLNLSPQDLVSCDFFNYACNGGNIYMSWLYVNYYGVTTDACIPYTANLGVIEPCRGNCKSATSVYQKYFSSSKNPKKLQNSANIKAEIFARGPVETGYIVYSDFMYYKSGIYTYKSGSNMGGHAIEVVGWGKDKTTGVNFWIAKNSWGAFWGESGYFKFREGQCNFEINAVVGDPDLYRKK